MTIHYVLQKTGRKADPLAGALNIDEINAQLAAKASLSDFEDIRIDETVQRYSNNNPEGAEFFGSDAEGKAHFVPSQRSAKKIGDLLPGKGGVFPNRDLAIYGDSMAAGFGAGGPPNDIATLVGAALGRTAHNLGIGGQNTYQIAFRAGAYSLLVNVNGNEIPISGPVAIDSRNQNMLSENGVFTGTMHVLIAGVPGIISTDGLGAWTFTRDYAGYAVPTTAWEPAVLSRVGTSFIPNPYARHDDTAIIWMGRNDGWADRSKHIITRDMHLRIVDQLSPYHKNFLCLSILNGRRINSVDTDKNEGAGTSRYDAIMALNDELSQTFGANFIDLRRYMVRHAIYDYGLTPTATDILDMEADCIPTQLMADDYHLLSYVGPAGVLARAIKGRGY